MAIHVDAFVFSYPHPDQSAGPWLRILTGFNCAVFPVNVDGLRLETSLRIDGESVNEEFETRFELRDPDGKVLLASPAQSHPLLPTQFGAATAMITVPLSGVMLEAPGPYEATLYVNEQPRADTILPVDRDVPLNRT